MIVASFGELCQSDIIVRNIIVPPAGSQHETHERSKERICNLMNEVHLGWGYAQDEQVLGLCFARGRNNTFTILSALNAHKLELFSTNDAVKKTVCAAAEYIHMHIRT